MVGMTTMMVVLAPAGSAHHPREGEGEREREREREEKDEG